MTKKVFAVVGDEYVYEGFSTEVTIFKGSKAKCYKYIEYHNFGGQYGNIGVVQLMPEGWEAPPEKTKAEQMRNLFK